MKTPRPQPKIWGVAIPNRPMRRCVRLENVDEHTFFKKTTGNLRGHSLTLYHKPVRLGVRKFFFSQRIVDNWNRLPEEAVSASSLSAFKKKLDNWMDLK